MSYRDCPQCGVVTNPHECPQTYVMQLQAEIERLRADKDHWIKSGIEYGRGAQEIVAKMEAEIGRLRARLGTDGRCSSCYHVAHTCTDPESECVCEGPSECRKRRIARYGRI